MDILSLIGGPMVIQREVSKEKKNYMYSRHTYNQDRRFFEQARGAWG